MIRGTIISGEQRTGISWWGVPQEVLEDDRISLIGVKELSADSKVKMVLKHY